MLYAEKNMNAVPQEWQQFALRHSMNWPCPSAGSHVAAATVKSMPPSLRPCHVILLLSEIPGRCFGQLAVAPACDPVYEGVRGMPPIQSRLALSNAARFAGLSEYVPAGL